MLSRIAESLYWIGRYIERAEDTARLLDVHYHLLLEDRRADEAAVCRALLDAMGVDPTSSIGDERRRRRRSPRCSRRTSTFSGSITCSIARRVGERPRRARGACRRRCGRRSTPRTASSARPARVRRPAAPATSSSAGCKDRAAACRGIVDTTMSRDDGWRFFVARPQPRTGRHDRRGCSRPRYGDAFGPHRMDDHAAVLLGLRGLPAHVPARGRRVVGGRVPPPRPAVPALGVPRAHDGRAAGSASSTRRRRAPGVDDEARRRLGRASAAELEFLRVDEALDDLPELLDRLQRECARGARRDRRRATSARPASIEWSVLTMSLATAGPAHAPAYRVRGRRARVVQRGAHLAARHRRTSSRSSTGSRCSPPAQPLPVPRLLGHVGSTRSTCTSPHTRARRHRHLGRSRRRSARPNLDDVGRVGRDRRAGPHRPAAASTSRRRRSPRPTRPMLELAGELRAESRARAARSTARRRGCASTSSTSRARPACRRPRPRCCAPGAGVCQDFVHLGLAVLRAAGIPARYASGYLYPRRRRRDRRRPSQGESHAWLEAWVGTGTRSTRPTGPTSPSATCSSPAAATTPTSRR